jgi:hypothetical protein
MSFKNIFKNIFKREEGCEAGNHKWIYIGITLVDRSKNSLLKDAPKVVMSEYGCDREGCPTRDIRPRNGW